MSKDTITVYWAPALFTNSEDSWNLLYQSPQLINKKNQKALKPKVGIRHCPAVKDAVRNVYSLNSNIDDYFEIPLDRVSHFINNKMFNQSLEIEASRAALMIEREPQYAGFVNYRYNLAWAFFSEEPLIMRATSPWLPPSAPINGAFLVPGEFDIGRWFRPYNLEYVAPDKSSDFTIGQGDELAYLEFMTKKKIEFKRFMLSDSLYHLLREQTESTVRYGWFKPLSERYRMFIDSNKHKIVLHEIKKNLIE